METINECFMFIVAAKAAAEVEYGVVIFQRKGAEALFQFFESFTDLWWITLVGLCVYCASCPSKHSHLRELQGMSQTAGNQNLIPAILDCSLCCYQQKREIK